MRFPRFRLWPQSLAGRLAALLVLALVLAQAISFALFAGERIAAFQRASRDDVLARAASLAQLLEEVPPELHERLVGTARSPILDVRLAAEPIAEGNAQPGLRQALASATGKAPEDIRVTAGAQFRGSGGERRGREHRRRLPPGLGLSIRLDTGQWLNMVAQRPAAPPIGRAFLASILLSAAAVATIGALGVRWASRPLRNLADAADRLGRGEEFDALPEQGPEETRQANIAFNRMRERLDRFVRDRTAMLAAVAHDLRTPITSLRLRAEFIDDEENKAKVLETLAEMQAMTESVLAFARGDAETEPTRPTDLTALVESMVEDLAESGREVLFLPSPQLTLACRPRALRRALGNLLDNATTYGVRATAAVETAPGEARIQIADEGPGIPPENLERVFEPFVRLEESRSRETGGAGLGLAIARGIIRSHGGDVRLDNRPEGGLLATATLPL